MKLTRAVANLGQVADSFGNRLRQRREERQIDLIAISDRTKIKVALLEGLETDDVSQWPSGIFRRAYIRAYAQMVGLDPDEILHEFLRVHPDPGDRSVITAAAAAAAEEEYSKTAPALRLRTIVDSAIASLSGRSRPAAVAQTMASASVSEAAASQPTSTNHKEEPTAEAIAVNVQAAADSKLEQIARLCTELGRVVERGALQKLLEDCAAELAASGLIVWLWDDLGDVLRPALVHGYSDKVLARVPAVSRDADNATAEAFRSSAPCEVAAASTDASGALVVPLLAADGCAGVLAIELQHGVGLTSSLRATATTLAAALTQVVVRSRPVEREQTDEMVRPSVDRSA